MTRLLRPAIMLPLLLGLALLVALLSFADVTTVVALMAAALLLQ